MTQQAATVAKPRAMSQGGDVFGPPAFLFLGLAAAIPQWFDPGIRFLSPSLLIGLFLAWQGWQGMRWSRPMRLYMPMASAFVLWLGISSYANWSFGSVYTTVTIGLWVLFIVPGLGRLARSRKYRYAWVLGILIGSTFYVFAAVKNLVTGGAAIDLHASTLLGLNRNAVNMIVCISLPFLLTQQTPLSFLRRTGFRWVLLVLSLLWLVTSGGRSGVLAAGFIGLLYGFQQRGASTKARALILVALSGVAILAFTLQTGLGGDVVTYRLQHLFGDPEKDTSRVLLLKKAAHLGLQHPIFGIGLGNFQGAYDPVVEEAKSESEREVVLYYQAHNTYAELFAETGFVGLGLLVLLVGRLLVAAWAARDQTDTYLGILVISGAAFTAIFHSSLSVLIWYPMVFLMGAMQDPDAPALQRRRG